MPDALPRAVQARLDAQMALLNAAPACPHALPNGRGIVDDLDRVHCVRCVELAWAPLLGLESR